MDHNCFDSLARSVFAGGRRSRRAAVGVLLSTALIGSGRDATVAKKRGKRARATGNGQRPGQAGVEPGAACFPNANCMPGRGRNTSGCDFSGTTIFRNRNVRGANLSNSSFFGADLTGADFRGANLGGSCFAGADLTGAKLGNSVNLGGAIFCRTTMPDGAINNSGCEGETPCCHLLLQDCPPGRIECRIWDRASGSCDVQAGLLPDPVAACYRFPFCYPCKHEQPYWSILCNEQFPSCGGNCLALLRQPFPPAGGYCCPPNTCS